MTNNTLAVAGGFNQHSAIPAPVIGPNGVIFDTLGMPMSVAAAKTMTKTAIEAALSRTLAKLHHESVDSVDATAAIDSIEVVFLVGRFYRNLDRKQPDLSKIHRDRWSNLEGIAEVLQDTVGELA
ncbi:hypothetical protein HTS88_01985 [Pseudarthrobacter oxydans]|uniref:hypothetical protein n=1 Tax=Pseudarthrobacter oxydans TaxID=1671 RepID=UPI001572B09B|nr:hypothetical protein [Pseudarthrobacter oxydans]NSX35176.1 hypothetical protein [Pseudarthrobacter oxydans]